jgi:hypothetical protein
VTASAANGLGSGRYPGRHAATHRMRVRLMRASPRRCMLPSVCAAVPQTRVPPQAGMCRQYDCISLHTLRSWRWLRTIKDLRISSLIACSRGSGPPLDAVPTFAVCIFPV